MYYRLVYKLNLILNKNIPREQKKKKKFVIFYQIKIKDIKIIRKIKKEQLN